MSNEKTAVSEEIKETENRSLGIYELEEAIEAILFAAGHPIKYDKLSEVLGLSVKDIKKLLEAMAEKINAEGCGRGVMLLTYPDTCQLTTKEKYMPYIREALDIRRGGNLSASSMEVLTIVAYYQPVTRSDIDATRGVDSSYAVSSLLDKGLIESCGRLELPGRPMIYGTTDKFLRVFGLNSLDDLSKTEAISTDKAKEKDKEMQENSNESVAESETTADDTVSEAEII